MDQASADMQTETQKPQNQKNNENSPKHVTLLMRPGSSVLQMMVRPVQDLRSYNSADDLREDAPVPVVPAYYFWQESLTMVKSVTVI